MPKSLLRVISFAVWLNASVCFAQEVRVQPAEEVVFPTQADGNSPFFWRSGRLHLYTSIAWPLMISSAADLFGGWETGNVALENRAPMAYWAEAAWVADDGTVFGWYHHEPLDMYPGSMLTAPKIGAFISFDGGWTIQDLGIVLESGDPLDPGAQNGFFTGGHGDFSVVLDRQREYFYFFFTNYGGPAETQGVAVARMAFRDRFRPMGRVQKYHEGRWAEPGVGGRLTPILPAVRAWRHKDPDSFWGPSVHWNTYLSCFVMVLNHAAGEPGWAQEGIYITYGRDLSRPDSWAVPVKILDGAELPNWHSFYPQLVGVDPGGTDTLAGHTARLFVNGTSWWEVVFSVGEGGVRPRPGGR